MCYFRLFIVHSTRRRYQKICVFCKQDMISFLSRICTNKCPLEITVINLEASIEFFEFVENLCKYRCARHSNNEVSIKICKIESTMSIRCVFLRKRFNYTTEQSILNTNN